MPKRWTRTEDGYLRKHYPRQGPTACARHLARTRSAILNRAQRLGLISGQPNGFVPLCWVAPRGNGDKALSTAINQAQADGVLHCLEGRYTKHVVPEWWADKYAEQLGRERDTMTRTQDWLRTKDVANLIGCPVNNLTRNMAKAYGVARYLRHVERVEVAFPQRHYRWEPSQTREAVRKWRASRRRTRSAEARP